MDGECISLIIPYPDREDMTSSVEQYKIGRILNFFRGDGLNGFDSYLKLLGLKIISNKKIGASEKLGVFLFGQKMFKDIILVLKGLPARIV